MDVCGENGWTDGYCHPDRVRGCCTRLLSKSQSHYCANIFHSFCSVSASLNPGSCRIWKITKRASRVLNVVLYSFKLKSILESVIELVVKYNLHH